jgi:peptide/nickel transport system substrate-binding protein
MWTGRKGGPVGSDHVATNPAETRGVGRPFRLAQPHIRLGLVVALALAGASLVAGCGSSSSPGANGATNGATGSFYTEGTPGGTPVRGGTAVIDRSEATPSLDPLVAALAGETDIAIAIFDQLAETFPGPNRNPQPGLATSWKASPDGLTVTFDIRHNIEFSNGEPLTGEDVVYSLERLTRPEAISNYVSKQWKKITLANPMTVVIHLKQPAPALVEELTEASTSIVPKHLIEREGEKAFALHPVGTGPFVVTSATSGNTTVKMSRNPHYWRSGMPYLDGLVWNQVTEANSRMLAVRTGAANIATEVPFSQVGSLRKTPGVRILIRPLAAAVGELTNNDSSPLDETNVRKALSYATPRQAIIKSVYGGLAEVANNRYGVRDKYWDSSVPVAPYDLAKAKELLKHSSVPNGFNLTMTVESGEPETALIASIQQSAWAQIGVHAKIQTLPPTDAFSNLFAAKYQVFMLPASDTAQETYAPDPSWAQYANGLGNLRPSPTVTSLIHRAVTSLSETERAKLFGEIQDMDNWQEAHSLTIAAIPSLTLVGDSVRGFDVPTTNYLRLERAWLEK